jgi:pimeloyl-ACP methyl ester carboxylesterase
MTEPESRFLESARIRIHYNVWGDESKPPLILVHGGRDHSRNWDFVAERLMGEYAIYAPDLRGHGDSDWTKGPAYQLSHHVADLAKLVDTVSDGAPVKMIAHSMGGRIATDYACAFPEKVEKLVSIEGFGRPPSTLPPAGRLREFVEQIRSTEVFHPHVLPDIESCEKRMYEANKRLSPMMVKHLTKHAVRQVEGGYVWKFDYYHRIRSTPDWSMQSFKEMWSQLKTPYLLIGGSESEFAPNNADLVKLFGLHEVIVEGSGHWVHHDQLDEFVRLVREFFGQP